MEVAVDDHTVLCLLYYEFKIVCFLHQESIGCVNMQCMTPKTRGGFIIA